MIDVGTRTRARRRAAVGASVFAASIVPLRRSFVGPREETLFRAINDLPDRLFVPAWLLMQLGTVGMAPVAAAVAWTRGDRRLAARLLTAGVTTWGASKVVKRITRRPRPVALLHDAHVRGREAAGLGFPSGHAGVAVALGVAAWSRLDSRGRLAAAVLVPAVGGTRVYVGAHLPLDTISGAALGLTLDALVEWFLSTRAFA
jgi:membrane-associated phospholipid phosphatase